MGQSDDANLSASHAHICEPFVPPTSELAVRLVAKPEPSKLDKRLARELDVVAPPFKSYVIPISIVVLCGLFWIQRRGTNLIGKLFGPVICVWFAVICVARHRQYHPRTECARGHQSGRLTTSCACASCGSRGLVPAPRGHRRLRERPAAPVHGAEKRAPRPAARVRRQPFRLQGHDPAPLRSQRDDRPRQRHDGKARLAFEPVQALPRMEALTEEEPGVVDMETLLKGVCSKANFLDLFENFILFDESAGSSSRSSRRTTNSSASTGPSRQSKDRKAREGQARRLLAHAGGGEDLLDGLLHPQGAPPSAGTSRS